MGTGQCRDAPSPVPRGSRRPGSRRLHAGHHLASKRISARLIPESPPDASTGAFSSSLTTTVVSQRSVRRLEASLRRATPKGHETFISRTAPHQGPAPTSGPPCVQDTHRHPQLPPRSRHPAPSSSSLSTKTSTNTARPAWSPAPGTGSCTEADPGRSATWTGHSLTATGRHQPPPWPPKAPPTSRRSTRPPHGRSSTRPDSSAGYAPPPPATTSPYGPPLGHRGLSPAVTEDGSLTMQLVRGGATNQPTSMAGRRHESLRLDPQSR